MKSRKRSSLENIQVPDSLASKNGVVPSSPNAIEIRSPVSFFSSSSSLWLLSWLSIIANTSNNNNNNDSEKSFLYFLGQVVKNGVSLVFYLLVGLFALFSWISLCLFLTLLYFFFVYRSNGTGMSGLGLLGLTFLGLESAFLLSMLVLKETRSLSHDKSDHRISNLPVLAPEERKRRVGEMLEYTPNTEAFLSGWFFGAPLSEIGSENMVEWLGSCIFNKHPSELEPCDRQELAIYIKWTEELISRRPDRMGFTFFHGYNEKIACLRPILDPIEVVHKPLIFYLLIILTNFFAGLIMVHIFNFARCSLNSRDDEDDESESKAVYWIRDQRKSKKDDDDNPIHPLPLVFFHGIGIGYATYITFLASLILRYPNVSILLFEKPSVSMRLNYQHRLPQEFADEVAQVLKAEGFENGAVFAGHSLGTACVTWLCKFYPQIVRSTLFIDPICFGLWTHHVAFNFLYREPKSVFEYLIKYTVSSEYGVSVYLRRYFCWYFNTFFPSEMPGGAHVYLSEKDGITDPNSIIHFIKLHNQTRESSKKAIQCVMFKGLTHGQVLASPDLIAIIDDLAQQLFHIP